MRCQMVNMPPTTPKMVTRTCCAPWDITVAVIPVAPAAHVHARMTPAMMLAHSRQMWYRF
jgi:hypothetical protein